MADTADKRRCRWEETTLFMRRFLQESMVMAEA
jgi:hypothetical protein